jgi:hypothetical protein
LAFFSSSSSLPISCRVDKEDSKCRGLKESNKVGKEEASIFLGDLLTAPPSSVRGILMGIEIESSLLERGKTGRGEACRELEAELE